VRVSAFQPFSSLREEYIVVIAGGVAWLPFKTTEVLFWIMDVIRDVLKPTLIV